MPHHHFKNKSFRLELPACLPLLCLAPAPLTDVVDGRQELSQHIGVLSDVMREFVLDIPTV